MASKVYDTYRKLADKARQQLDLPRQESLTRIQVGSATCENAAGAEDIFKEFRKHVQASGRDDILLRRTGCTGRCSREPIVNVMLPEQLPVKYEQVTHEQAHEIFTSHVQQGKPVVEHVLDQDAKPLHLCDFLFCGGERCRCGSAKTLIAMFKEKLLAAGVVLSNLNVIQANCFGLCGKDKDDGATHVLVRPDNVIYRIESEQDIDRIIDDHLLGGKPLPELRVGDEPMSERFFRLYGDVAFFNQQSRLALRNSGIVDPENLYEYINYNGFEALAKALDGGDPQWIIDEVTRSKLRGRGGGGFPTGAKWANAAEQDAEVKYVICNADEGDPGAFMDRSMLEGDPLSVIEGMAIGAYAVGAHQGFLYVRAEYPMAIQRLEKAIDLARSENLLGNDILGSGFDFDLEIRLGAGAFVCGEETALIHSIEGQRGQPRIRPPYPTQSGLWGKPTVINNVETWANVPVVLHYGADWFARIGTEGSGGTKVFALAGKVEHTGLVEVPMGTTLRQIVFGIGGGVPDGKALKAIQTGGPAGGCIPAEWLDTPVDFDTLSKAGTIMGSGGRIVMDEDDCMVDIAKFFLTFSKDESCGKCTPCREGTTRMLEILERITTGQAEPADLDRLERLARLCQKASLCGLGRAAPNPVLSTLTHYREEYEAHVADKSCPAHKCTALVRFEIDPDTCVGCTACARNCPVSCIHGQPKKVHEIDQSRCIKCGRCYEVCRFDAVNRL
jgi:NADH:ubiquinone oxidoreductase subunit F (NADH-binding)/(2Fe-2S) ferredoxin/ferredoxin